MQVSQAINISFSKNGMLISQKEKIPRAVKNVSSALRIAIEIYLDRAPQYVV